MTFGIVPTAPETGYGYIEASEPFSSGEPVHVPIKRFVEKPDQATAEQFLTTGRFTWNSGMFLFGPARCWRNWSGWPPRW